MKVASQAATGKGPAAKGAGAGAGSVSRRKKTASAAQEKKPSSSSTKRITKPTAAAAGATSKAQAKRKQVNEAEQECDNNGKKQCVRGATLRKKASQKLMEKKERAMSQRMMLVSRERSSNDTPSSSSSPQLQETFKVLGSTGNVYSVVVDTKPRCDCPDARKNVGDICKHVVFVFLKVLKIPETDHYWYQKALLPSELIDIFAKAKPDPTLTNAQLQSAYLVATGQLPAAANSIESPSHGRRNIPQLGEVSCCPICYEDFIPGETKGLVFCETSCGNPVHKECFKQWIKSCPSNQVTCVWCRTVLAKEDKGDSSSLTYEHGMQYVNLAHHSGIDSNRDFSCYSRSSLLGMYSNGTISREEYVVFSGGR